VTAPPRITPAPTGRDGVIALVAQVIALVAQVIALVAQVQIL